MIAAIEHADRERSPLWVDLKRGLKIAAQAIEQEYHLPAASRTTLGQGSTLQPLVIDEPPAEPLARSSEERRVG